MKKKNEINMKELEMNLQLMNDINNAYKNTDKRLNEIISKNSEVVNKYNGIRDNTYIYTVLNEYSKVNIRIIKKIINTDNEMLYKVCDYIYKYTIDKIDFNNRYTNFLFTNSSNDVYGLYVSNSYKKLLQVLSVSFKDNIKKPPKEIVENSIVKLIQDKAKYIIRKLNEINKVAELCGKELPIKLTTTTNEIMCFLSEIIVDNEENYEKLINKLYKLLFENKKRLVGESTELDFINVIRRYYFHDLEHGKNKDSKKKIKELKDLNIRLIGKVAPSTAKEWQKLQLALYDKIIEVLDKIEIIED